MSTRVLGLLGAAAALALLAAPARADLVIERTVREFGPKPAPQADKAEKKDAPETAPAPASTPEAKPEIVELASKRYTVKMAQGKLRETCAADGSVTVLRSDLGLLWQLDPEKKTYREISFRALAAAADSSRERLRRRLALVSDPGLRERLRALLEAEGDPLPVTIERPGTTRKIAGESCELVVVKAGPEEIFRAYLSARAAPTLEQPWLTAGHLLAGPAAAKLGELKGLVMEAVFPLPDGGRIEIVTERLTEAQESPGDYEDPAKLGYARLGGAEKPAEKKPADKPPAPPSPPGLAPDKKG